MIPYARNKSKTWQACCILGCRRSRSCPDLSHCGVGRAGETQDPDLGVEPAAETTALFDMFRVFRHYIPKSIFLLGVIEAVLLGASLVGALYLRYWMIDTAPPELHNQFPEIAFFNSLLRKKAVFFNILYYFYSQI